MTDRATDATSTPHRRVMDHQVEDLRRQIQTLQQGWTTLDAVVRGGNGQSGIVATLAKIEAQAEARAVAIEDMSGRIAKLGEGLQGQITELHASLTDIHHTLDAQQKIEQGQLLERQRIAKWLKIGAAVLATLTVGGGVSLATLLQRVSEVLQQLP